MSNPYDPRQQDPQQWGQPAYPGQQGQGYGEQVPPSPHAQGQWAPEPQAGGQWSGGQEWQPQAPPPAEPAQINWGSGVPQPAQAPWQGPAAFAPPAPQQSAPPAAHPAQDQPWVAAGTAQTAQEVAGQWQTSQPPAPAADYQPPAPEPHAYQPPAPEPYQPPAAPQQEQWPSYNAPASPSAPSTVAPGVAPINEAATVTTPAVADPAAQAEEEPEALTIGRGRGNSIVLDDMLVSRQHVRITADADGLVLEDLGSRNGTYVNGRRVERTHLSEGDRIGIGAATFEVRDGWLLNV